MARLAHESRNSLQRIQIAVETARLHTGEGTSLADQLDSIERASDGLDALLDELKNYAAPLNLEKSKISLATIWREAWQATSPSRVGRVVDFQEQLQGVEPICQVDRFRLGQVFRNLFENSLAACQDPVAIVLNVTESHTNDRLTWRLRFQDNGPGLDQQQKARILNRSSQQRLREPV